MLLFYFNTLKLFYRNSGFKKNKLYNIWIKAGKPLPPPHIVKEKIILEYAENFNLTTLIETGTYLGDMIYSQTKYFKRIISIELSPYYYNNARRRFNRKKNVEVILGDSGSILQKMAEKGELNHPCVFWLDGHFSGGTTALGEKVTPIVEELEAIIKTHPGHVILIDDARLFTGQNGYPSFSELEKIIYTHKPNFSITLDNDIIRICRTGLLNKPDNS